MSLKIVLILLAVLIAICTSLFASVIIIKLNQTSREKSRNTDQKSIKPILNKLLAADPVIFFKNHTQGISKLSAKLERKTSVQTLEDMLLTILEDTNGETRVKANTIAYQFGFPEKSISMIRERLTGNIAIGCRKAGLYQYEGAIPDILKTLDILSSNTQYQSLMALARIGNAAVMIQAFDKINRLIYVNERTISEILNTFSGDRYELFKEMIHHKSEYLVRLFLKAIDKETASALIEEISSISESSGKETRLAAIIAIGKSGNSEKIPILIKALNDKEWEIRAMAAKTLGALTGPAAVTALAGAARDREWWVRQNAITSILAYPSCNEILVSIVQTGDRYAYDSISYALGKTDDTKLLASIRKVWTEKSNSANLL